MLPWQTLSLILTKIIHIVRFDTKGETAIGYRFFICLLIFLCYVLVFFHRLCTAVIALDIQSSFGITGTLLGILGSAYFYSYAIMQLPTGLMADSWGPRKTVSAFFVLAGIGSILTAGSQGQMQYALASFRYMFLICLTGAVLSLAVTFVLKETLVSQS